MPDEPLHRLSLLALVEGIRATRFTAKDVIASCLERICDREPAIGAWVRFDPEFSRRQADASPPDGPLHGIPFGAKDVFETVDLPTQMGSKLYSDYRPRYDAGLVAHLRGAGALLMGKTVTAEFAGTQPTRTANPYDPGHTPGGSSSGSAAAVADFMVPLALGTQTGGSILRPAAFCGVVGFKPTFGFYSPAGMKLAAHSFDTAGLITRFVEDAALVHAILMDERFSCAAKRPKRMAILKTHLWDTVDADSRRALEVTMGAAEADGVDIVEIDTPPEFDAISEKRAIINAFERARNLAAEWLSQPEEMSAQSADVCKRGFAIPGRKYVAARRDVELIRQSIGTLFTDADVLLTPATPGEAPRGKDYAGDPRLQELWTMLHLPSITLPVLRGSSRLPVGIQLVGDRFADTELLATASWMEKALAARLYQ